jgi:hypothetical protein
VKFAALKLPGIHAGISFERASCHYIADYVSLALDKPQNASSACLIRVRVAHVAPRPCVAGLTAWPSVPRHSHSHEQAVTRQLTHRNSCSRRGAGSSRLAWQPASLAADDTATVARTSGRCRSDRIALDHGGLLTLPYPVRRAGEEQASTLSVSPLFHSTSVSEAPPFPHMVLVTTNGILLLASDTVYLRCRRPSTAPAVLRVRASIENDSRWTRATWMFCRRWL